MARIKQKVEKNLIELIEWAMENKIKNKRYVSNNHYIVAFDKVGFLQNSTLPLDEKFTVEVEESITEDTVLPESLVVFEHNGNLYTERHNSECITKILCLDKKVKGSGTKTIYILNEGGALTLIWTKEEGLVK